MDGGLACLTGAGSRFGGRPLPRVAIHSGHQQSHGVTQPISAIASGARIPSGMIQHRKPFSWNSHGNENMWMSRSQWGNTSGDGLMALEKQYAGSLRSSSSVSSTVGPGGKILIATG